MTYMYTNFKERNFQTNFTRLKMIYKIKISKSPILKDCRRGQSLVVWAIHEGRQAARQIDEDLMGFTSLAGPAGVIDPHRTKIKTTYSQFPRFSMG